MDASCVTVCVFARLPPVCEFVPFVDVCARLLPVCPRLRAPVCVRALTPVRGKGRLSCPSCVCARFPHLCVLVSNSLFFESSNVGYTTIDNIKNILMCVFTYL